MTSVRKSLAISFADKYSVMLIQFASTLILARLLTPEDIGVFTIGAVIIGFAHMIRDFGVSNYIVQEKELSQERLRTAFGVTLLISWSASLTLFLLSIPIGNYYQEEGVSNVIFILAVNFLIIPFNSTVLGLLRRDLKFNTLFIINFLSALVNTLTAISLAYLGHGFLSLAWASVAGTATTVVVGIINRPENAQFIPSYKEFKRIFSYGSYSSLAAIIQEIGLSAPDLAIGKLLGFSTLGYYSRAVGILSVFNQAITSAVSHVSIATFAKYSRDNEDLKGPYLKALNCFTMISLPFYGYCYLLAEPIVYVLFGDQWLGSIPLIKLLCIAFAFRSLSTFAGDLTIALGKVKLRFNLMLALQIPRAIITIIAAFYSVTAVAIVQILFYLISFVVFHIFIEIPLGVTVKNLAHTLKESFYTMSLCVCVITIITNIFHFNDNFLPLLIASITVCSCWLFCTYIFSHQLFNELTTFIKKNFRINHSSSQ